MPYYFIERGTPLSPAQAAAVQASGATVVVVAPPGAPPAPGMIWAAAPPAFLNGVLTQQWPETPAPTATAAETAAAILSAGCAVVSTRTAALTATYPLDQLHLDWLAALGDSLNAGEGLPNGRSTVAIPDVRGQLHDFTAPQLIALGAALRNVFYDLQSVLTGASSALPAQPALIP